MIGLISLVSAAFLLAPKAPASTPVDPCKLLTPDQIKAVVGVQTTAQPAGTKDAPDCTWHDAKGPDSEQVRVYLDLKPPGNFNVTRAQMQNTGHLVNVSGIGEDAFFVSGAVGSTAYLYTMGKHHLLLLQVNIPNASRQDNEAAEKALATEILPKL